MSSIKVTPESYRTSIVTPIELSQTTHTETTFEVLQVDNMVEPKKNLKGKLIIKKKTNSVHSFGDVTKFSKKDIHSNEMVEISLDTAETYALGEGLFNRYRLLQGQMTNPYEETTYVMQDQKIKQLRALLQNREDIYEALTKVDLSVLNVALNIENLRRAKMQMQENMRNDGESEFWQSFFTQNSWILAQLFHAPVMFFKDQRYVGGKNMNNHGGQYTDLVYKNDITDNIALIEIKSPVKRLLGKEYRQTFSISDELSGGVNQLLKQRETLYKSYAALLMEVDDPEEKFEANNIECVLVIGNVSELSQPERRVFETYRNELRTVKIVGFDELLHRIDNQISLLEQA